MHMLALHSCRPPLQLQYECQVQPAAYWFTDQSLRVQLDMTLTVLASSSGLHLGKAMS